MLEMTLGGLAFGICFDSDVMHLRVNHQVLIICVVHQASFVAVSVTWTVRGIPDVKHSSPSFGFATSLVEFSILALDMRQHFISILCLTTTDAVSIPLTEQYILIDLLKINDAFMHLIYSFLECNKVCCDQLEISIKCIHPDVTALNEFGYLIVISLFSNGFIDFINVKVLSYF